MPPKFGSPKCGLCGKSVYTQEQILLENVPYHKDCLKCVTCSKKLDETSARKHESKFYCVPHHKQASTGQVPPSQRMPPPAETTSRPASYPENESQQPEQRARPSQMKTMPMPGMGMPGGPAPPLSVRIFRKYDKEGTGHMSPEDFRDMCMELGYRLSDEELNFAIKMLDSDANGTIEYNEFEPWWKQDSRFSKLQLSEDQLSFLQTAFAKFITFDDDKSGTVDKTEFSVLYNYLVNDLAITTLVDEGTVWQMMDSDNTGYVSFNNYVNWLLEQDLRPEKIMPDVMMQNLPPQ